MNDLESEAQTKHERVAEFLDGHGLDALFLSRRCNVAWYTCGRVRNYVGTAGDAGNSVLLVDSGGARILTTTIEATRLQDEDLRGTGIEPVAFPWHDAPARARAFEEAVAGRRVAADAPVAGVAADPLPAEFDRLRWTLEPSELERYRAVAADVVDAVEATARSVEPGLTEDELAGALAGALRSRGLLPWVLLVAVDGRIDRFRHPLPTSARLRERLMLVTCSERGGLIAACTRLVSFRPLPARLADRHEAVATVDAALIAATRPGATLGDCLDTAREAYAATGYADEWQNHHQGGAIGYLPREAKACPGDETPVLANQAFAWNPSIAGTKSEDTVLCTEEETAPLAAATDWPTLTVEWQGAAMVRPAILVR